MTDNPQRTYAGFDPGGNSRDHELSLLAQRFLAFLEQDDEPNDDDGLDESSEYCGPGCSPGCRC